MLIVKHLFRPQTFAGELVQTADRLLGQWADLCPRSTVGSAVAGASWAVVAARGGTGAALRSASSGILRSELAFLQDFGTSLRFGLGSGPSSQSSAFAAEVAVVDIIAFVGTDSSCSWLCLTLEHCSAALGLGASSCWKWMRWPQRHIVSSWQLSFDSESSIVRSPPLAVGFRSSWTSEIAEGPSCHCCLPPWSQCLPLHYPWVGCSALSLLVVHTRNQLQPNNYCISLAACSKAQASCVFSQSVVSFGCYSSLTDPCSCPFRLHILSLDFCFRHHGISCWYQWVWSSSASW